MLLIVVWAVAGVGQVRAQYSETNTFSGLNKTIPDGIAAGVHDVRTVSSEIIFISSVRVTLNISGNFNGDLYGYVRHSSGFAVLLNRPGRTESNPDGYSDTGLNVSLADSGANDLHTYRTVVTPSPGSLLTGTWQPDARNVDPRSVTDASFRSAYLSAFNGLGAGGTWTLFLADVESGGTNVLNGWTLEITGTPRATPSITWTNPATITYGTPLSATQLNATANVPGTFTYTPAVGTFLSASNQTLSVYFAPDDTNNYVPTSANVSLSVLPKELTVTVDDKSKVYGAELPALTANYSGFVLGEDTNALTALATLATTATVASNVGTYPITATGAVSPNYTFTYLDGTLTVTPAALTVTADGKTKLYGAALPELTATYSGFVLDETTNVLTALAALATTATQTSNVGVYAISASGAASPNYTFTYVDGTLTIAAATITVSAENKSKLYGAELPELTANYTGFLFGEDTNVLTALATLATTASSASNVGVYPITADGAAAPNYAFAYVPGALTITPAALTVTADNKAKAYGAAVPELTASYSGFVLDENTNALTALATLTTTATVASIVGTYPIAPSGAASPNYSFTFIDGTLTVTAATITVTADHQSKGYGAALPELTATYSGLVLGEDTNVLTALATLTTTATGTSTVGDYSISAMGAAGPNYTFSYVDGTLTVTGAVITVTAENKSKVYGATLPELTASYVGFALGEDTNIVTALATVTTSAFATNDVGTYPITAGGATGPNYTFNYMAGTLTVTQAFTTGAVVTSTNPAPFSTNVTFTMTVSAVAPGAGTPGGTVNFRIDGALAGSGTLTNGITDFSTASLASGSHTVVAEYAGDLNFIGMTNALAPDQVIDEPLVESLQVLERLATQGIKVRSAVLVAGVLPPENRPFTVASVSATSEGGATMTLREGWVHYEPLPGFTNADSFTYVATNVNGVEVTRSVSVIVREDTEPSQNIVGNQDLGNGARRIQFQGIAGRTYLIQSTENLNSPAWQTYGTSQADETGWFEFTDTPTVGSPPRFYRSVSQAP